MKNVLKSVAWAICKTSALSMTVFLGVLYASAPALADSPSSPRLGLIGNDQVLWIYDHVPDPESEVRVLSFAVRSTRREGFYAPVKLRGLRGTVQRTALVGSDLYVFYDEGSHRRYRYDVGRISSHTELPLPNRSKPMALAGGAGLPSIYAVVTVETAREIWREQIARERAELQANHNANESEEPGEFDAVFEESRFALVHYSQSRWQVADIVPVWFDDQQDCRILIDPSGRIHLVFALSPEEPLQYSYFEDGFWNQPVTVTRYASVKMLSFFATDNLLTVVCHTQSDGQTPIRTLIYDGSGWSVGDQLILGDDAGELGIRHLAAGPFAGTIAIAIVDEQERLWCGRWPLEGAAALEPLQEVSALRHLSESTMTLRTQSLMAFGVLAMFLGFVFWRRQDSISRPLDLPSEYKIASLWRRMAGLVMDASPCAMLTIHFWWPPLAEWVDQYEHMEYSGGHTPPLSDQMLKGWLIACAVYTLYCMICETIFTTTPGKLAVQCRVADETGGRCSFARIFVRNVLRLVELFPLFQFWPTIILMFFSRNRQRLGDLTARTIVVQRVPQSGPGADSPSSHSQNEQSSSPQ